MRRVLTWALVLSLSAVASPARAADAIEVCATVPSLGSLASEVGGDAISLTVFARGREDAHFVEPRPSFIRNLADADLLILNGLDLELGWLPPLLKRARNRRILPGSPGYLDASAAIVPLEVRANADRSMGDVHARGNPHYLLDPVNGLAVAALIRDRLSQIRPDLAPRFAERYDDFAHRLGVALVGETLAQKYDVTKLTLLEQHGRLQAFLESQGEADLLGGWLGATRQPVKAVADHNLWVYFARRFGVDVVGFLEPKPGLPPTTRHLRDLVEQMQAENVELILSAAYYDPAHARFVSDNSGARVVAMAHEAGAIEGTESYLDMIDYNVGRVSEGR